VATTLSTGPTPLNPSWTVQKILCYGGGLFTFEFLYAVIMTSE